MVNKFDVAIVGGGAAGMMAAISTKRHNPDKSVGIIDRTIALGRKILICGAGRCNITNINLADKIDESYYGASKDFLHSIFDEFGYAEIVEFFNEMGVELYVERKTDIGKLFPVTNQAKTITELMLDEIERLGIQIFLNTEVTKIEKQNNKFVINTKTLVKEGQKDDDSNILNSKDPQFQVKYLILSTGGKTYPALGSDGSGYLLAKRFGHSIVHPIPSALPLEAKHPLSHYLQGQKMEIEVTSVIDGKKVKTRNDDVMFTKYGLSGPAILNISREISISFHREKKDNAEVLLNFFPGKNYEEVMLLLNGRWEKRPDQTVEKSLYGIFPNKIALAVLKYIESLSKVKREIHNLQAKELNYTEKEVIVQTLVSLSVNISGTRGWNEAEFTAGGVDTTEVKEGTLESKMVKSLYFCGEILNVDGDVGGFNLSWSWASGYVAGKLD